MAMNLSAPFLVQFFGEQMSTALAYCDYVFGNESEAAAFGEKHEWGTDISAIALKLSGKRTYHTMLSVAGAATAVAIVLCVCL